MLAASRRRSRQPGVIGFALAMLLVSAHVPALADVPAADDSRAHFSLSWARLRAAESCISAVELSRAVEARLGRPVFGALAQTDVAIEGSIWLGRSDDRFHALLSLVDQDGRRTGFRELVGDGSNCRDLDEAIVLALSLMIDPKAAFAAESPPTKPARPHEPPPGSALRQPRGSIWAGDAALGYGLYMGVLSKTAQGIWLHVSVEPPGVWPVQVWATYLPPQVETIDGVTRIAFSRASLGLATCPLAAHASRVGYAICVGAEGGSLVSSGVGRTGLMHQQRPIVDGVLGGQLHLELLPRISAMLASAGMAHFYRDSFEYRAQDGTTHEVFRPPLFGASFGLGILFRLP